MMVVNEFRHDSKLQVGLVKDLNPTFLLHFLEWLLINLDEKSILGIDSEPSTRKVHLTWTTKLGEGIPIGQGTSGISRTCEQWRLKPSEVYNRNLVGGSCSFEDKFIDSSTSISAATCASCLDCVTQEWSEFLGPLQKHGVPIINQGVLHGLGTFHVSPFHISFQYFAYTIMKLESNFETLHLEANRYFWAMILILQIYKYFLHWRRTIAWASHAGSDCILKLASNPVGCALKLACNPEAWILKLAY